MEYKLKDFNGKIIKGITIDAKAKREFKKLMFWTEKNWKNHTSRSV